jgi:hypothetical protein
MMSDGVRGKTMRTMNSVPVAATVGGTRSASRIDAELLVDPGTQLSERNAN